LSYGAGTGRSARRASWPSTGSGASRLCQLAAGLRVDFVVQDGSVRRPVTRPRENSTTCRACFYYQDRDYKAFQPCSYFRKYQNRRGEREMSWKTPKIIELAVGLEINMYACAVRK
jgi:coenzyme PQQ precursor peptide PqqA